ncbi:MAG: AMP-binding protein [Microthrixaceae bacterium]
MGEPRPVGLIMDETRGPAWEADTATIEASVTHRFMARHGIDRYADLVDRSIAEPDWFWDEVVSFLGLPFRRPYSRVSNGDLGVEWTTWFDDGRINLSEVCLDRWADDPEHRNRPALVTEDEDGTTTEATFAELRDRVARLAGALRAEAGVGRGDRVAILLGLGDAVAAFLAVARLGAVAVPVFTGFGASAVQARLVDAACTAIVTATGAARRGRTVPLAEVAIAAAEGAGSDGVAVQVVGLADLEHSDAPPAPVADTAAEDRVLLAYTSGTTGRPKGAVHVHGGLTVKLAQEGAFQADLQPGDRACWLTDMGWIMGPWITVAALANGATLVTYDGAPDWPEPDRAWSLVEAHRLTFLGVSPTLIRALAAEDDGVAAERRDLTSLRAFGSTGEPWNDEPWWWLFERVGRGRVPIVNLSGGTEVGACLLSVNLLQGCKPCSLGGPALGIPVDVVDDAGHPVRGAGNVGELVARGAWPGMTRGVWGDDARYHEAYWSRFEGLWCHGDWAEIDDDGFWFLHGRSDDTLNIAGKRIGPAELESPAVAVEGVASAAAVGLPHPVKGEVVGLWCVPAAGRTADEALARAVSDSVVEAFGKPFRPAHVAFVEALPLTRSGKVVRRAVRARAVGEDPGDVSSLANPEALDGIEAIEPR